MARRNLLNYDMIRRMESEIQQFTDETLRSALFQPAVDIYETPDAVTMKVELAGVKAENLHITLSSEDRSITIAGQRIETAQERTERIRCHQLEIYYGAFQREIALPANHGFDRNAITANYKDGFLVIRLIKLEKRIAETRVIPIESE